MPPGKIEGGEIFFDVHGNGLVDLLKISEPEMRDVRGSQIAMVFQEPGSALNPVFTIGDQLTEGIMLHRRREIAGLALTRSTAGWRMKKQPAFLNRARHHSTGAPDRKSQPEEPPG